MLYIAPQTRQVLVLAGRPSRECRFLAQKERCSCLTSKHPTSFYIYVSEEVSRDSRFTGVFAHREE